MTKLEVILEQANGLSPSEREELLRLLSTHGFSDDTEEEAAVGRRGLAAWTQSTQVENWSMFYPDALRNGGRSRS